MNTQRQILGKRKYVRVKPRKHIFHQNGDKMKPMPKANAVSKLGSTPRKEAAGFPMLRIQRIKQTDNEEK